MAPFIFFLILIISISFPLSFNKTFAINECHGTIANRPPAIFAFGDSYFDPGNNNYIKTITLDQANFWPYGETYFNFPTGRFSDGRLLSNFIAEYAKKPLIPAYMRPGIEGQYREGVNFASGGAGALVETFQGSGMVKGIVRTVGDALRLVDADLTPPFLLTKFANASSALPN